MLIEFHFFENAPQTLVLTDTVCPLNALEHVLSLKAVNILNQSLRESFPNLWANLWCPIMQVSGGKGFRVHWEFGGGLCSVK